MLPAGASAASPPLCWCLRRTGPTVYHLRARHRHQEVQEVLPADDDGGMVTDRGRRAAAQTFDRVDQHQCLAHILRSIREVGERKRGRARDFGEQLNTVLQDALALWHTPRATPMADFKVEAEALQTALSISGETVA